MEATDDRFHRQRLLFGDEGQARISAARVAVVGLGGTGSHIAQQLAYLGTRYFVLFDADHVSRTSLNRLIGATEADVGEWKVRVAEREILRHSPRPAIHAVPDTFLTESGAAALRECDAIFAGVDSGAARLLLAEFARTYRKPYIDTAADTDPDDVRNFGGHVLLSEPSRPGCVSCYDLLDSEEVRRSLRPPEARALEEAIYGVPRGALADVGPSVVALNGIVASLAVTEYLKYITGVLPAAQGVLRYRGRVGRVFLEAGRANESCPYCDTSATPEQIDWERHLRQGLGRWVR
jgi:molybdopterin/thiamine biosynthesis adenylyltransferase